MPPEGAGCAPAASALAEFFREPRMSVTIEDYPDPNGRLSAEEVLRTTRLLFVPNDLSQPESADGYVVRGEATTIAKILRNGGAPVGYLGGDGVKVRFVHNKSHDWAAPVIFVASELLKTSPNLLSITIDLIRDYAIDLFKGAGSDRVIKADIVVEKQGSGTYCKVSYEGDAEGLHAITAMVEKVHANG